jgi:hypothetical protein
LGSSQGSDATSRSPIATSTGTVITAASAATMPGATMRTAHDGAVADRHGASGPSPPAAMSCATTSAGSSS